MKSVTPYLARSHSGRHENRKPAQPPAAIAAKDLKRLVGGSHRAHEQKVIAVVQWCVLHRLPVLEIYTGPRVRPREGGGFDLSPNRANVGISDVITLIPPVGRLVMVEVKSGNARRTPEQIQLQQRFADGGALCLVVRDDVHRDLEIILREERILRDIYEQHLNQQMGATS